MKIAFKEEFNSSDLEEAAYCFGVDVDSLIFERYDIISPQELIWFDGDIPMFNESHKKFGWGKDFLIDELEEALDKKYQRNYHWFTSQCSSGLNPVILINNKICDGAGRAILCHALGQDIRVAKFKVK